MKFKVRITHRFKHEDDMLELLQSLVEKVNAMSQALDDLTREVAETTSVVTSAIVLIQGLKVALDAAGTDPIKLAELAATLDAQQSALAAAIVDNTPAAP